MHRREFLRTVAVGAAASTPLLTSACRPRGLSGSNVSSPDDPWTRLPSILARIQPPTFSGREFEITRYGAIGDGTTLCTRAFRDAIAACSAAGGGRVVVPPGRFLTGAIHLDSNVNLHLARGSTILFSRDPKVYLPQVLTRFEGTELMNYSPIIYALDKENVAITGEGTLDGQASAESWWGWKGSKEFGWKPGDPNYNAARQRLLTMAEHVLPVS